MLSDSSNESRRTSLIYKLLVLLFVGFTGLALYIIPPYITVFALVIGTHLLGVDGHRMEVWFDTTAAIFTLTLITEVLVVIAIVFLLKQLKQTWGAIGVRRPKFSDVGYMLAGFGVYLVTYMVVAGLLRDTLDFDQRQELGFDTAVYGIDLWMVFVSLVILPPLVEEILFRGFLYTQLKRAFRTIWAAIIVSILFAAAHLQFGTGNPLLWVAALDTFILSMVLVYLRERTGSIWAGVGVHALKNLIAFSILFVFQIA